VINPLGDRSPLSDLHRHYSPYGLTTAHKNIPCLLTDWNSHKKKRVSGGTRKIGHKTKIIINTAWEKKQGKKTPNLTW
jgi:hypothetical protein